MITLVANNLFAQSAKDIIAKADDYMKGDKSYAEMTIDIIRPTWNRTMKMKSWSFGTEYSISYILAPSKDKGTVFLKRDRELWNWLPTIERTVKMPPSMLSQSWMGTDLTNDDLVRESSNKDDYDASILGEESLDGHDTWKLELIPHPDASVVWGKVITWVDKDTYVYLKNEFYDEDDYLVNTMTSSDIKKVGSRYVATEMVVIPADNPENKTVLKIDKIDFNPAVKKSFFTVQQMKRLR